MSAIFFHNEEQEQQAISSKARIENELNSVVNTEIKALDKFYPAEDYHQKYYLQNEQELAHELKEFYPDFDGFVNSTAAARLNGIIGGYADPALLEAEINSYGLSDLGLELLKRYLR